MLATFAFAQVEDGKVYRIVSAKYGTVISESPILHTLSCASKGAATDYHEMWLFNAAGDGKFTIKNVYTQRYVQYNSVRNGQWTTSNSATQFTVTENPNLKGYYNIDLAPRNDWGAHCDGSGNIVPWNYGPDNGEISGTEWTFELVEISADEMTAAGTAYQDYATVLNNANAIAAKVMNLFKDNACTELKDEWAAKSDAEIAAELEGVPADLQQVVLKIKNNAWDSTTREKEFRVYDYKPYSNPEVWADRLFTRPYNRINNPTGISTSDSKSFIYVFVEDIPEGTTIDLAEMASTKYFGNDTRLKEGLNIVPCANKDGSLYIRYICETALDGKKLADYPTVKVHIEGGYVNGFWSKERGHTNTDWVYMRNNMFKNPTAVQAAGDLTVLNFRTYEFLKECPDNIEGVMRLWDFWNSRQNYYMALDKYDAWRNNKQLAMSDDNGFMDASSYRTHYNNNTLSTIVNYDLLVADAGSSWGPNHEIGHTNQYAFEIVGTSEVSNNALTNFAIFDQGTHVSRGNNMQNQILDFENKIPYVVRGEKTYGSKLFSMTRMYFQLFLYFHAAGKDTTFYPRLFEKLRYDRLPGWATGSWDELDENGFYKNSVDASKDQLKFAEACCEIAQMDLSEFFEAWGFFIPMKNAFVGDYGHHWVYLLEEDAKASKARMQKYEKKGGHLMFLEDRIRKSPRKKSPFSDGKGYRANYADWEGERIADPEIGLYGQWMDYIDESVKAQGYYYAVSQGVVLIKEAENAGGALGFKLYNAETGELLTYTNKKSMKVPSSAQGATLKVVAAQADGTDYVVPHASEGPAEMQKEALKGSIGKAMVILNKIAENEVSVGRYYPEAVANLQELTNKAVEAYSAAVNNSEYSYAEWSMIIDEECNKVLNNEDARVLIKEGATFKMKSYRTNYRNYYLVGNYPNADKTEDDEKDPVEWEIEYAGVPGEYYLKSASTGYYITEIGVGGIGLASKEQVNAIKFTVAYTDAATVKFISVDDENMAVGLYDGGKVAGIPVDDSGSGAEWVVEIVKNNTAEFYTQALEELMAEANIKITEVLNLDSLNTMNIFNDNIIVLDNNLNTYALDLLYTYYEVSEKAEAASVAQKQKYVAALRKQLLGVEGRYLLIAPIVTAGERVVWHYIISNKTEKLVGISTSGRNKGVLAPVTDYETDNVLWSFVSTGKANEYKLYNAGQKGFVYKKGTSELRVSATEDYLPVTVKYDAEVGGLVLSAAERYFNESTSSVSLGITNNTVFRIQTALIETNKEVADVITVIESVLPEANGNDAIYDLGGRRVEKPTRGIFIQNGKKVLVK